MAGHRPFRELTKDFSPELRKKIDEEKSELLRERESQEEQQRQRGETRSAPASSAGQAMGNSPCKGEGGERSAWFR